MLIPTAPLSSVSSARVKAVTAIKSRASGEPRAKTMKEIVADAKASDLDQKIKTLLTGAEREQNEGLMLLYSNFGGRILKYFRDNNLSEADSEDLTQETFLKALISLRNRKFYPTEAKVSTWLYRIAIHRLLNKRRRLKREVPLEDQLDPEFPPFSDVDLEELERRKKCLREFVDTLPPDEKGIARLYFYEGLGPKAIWETLGISDGVVRGIIQRVRSRFRTIVKERSGSDEPKSKVCP